MKILMVNEQGHEEGGAETYLLNLKRGLEKKKHNVKILTPEGATGKVFSDFTFSRINKRSLTRLLPYIWNHAAYKKLLRVIRDFKPDIIHFHFVDYNTSVSVLSPVKNIPTTYTMHGHELIAPMGLVLTNKCKHPTEGYCIYCYGYSRYIPELIKRKLLKHFSKNIDLFIAPSKHHFGLLKNNNYSPSLQLYNGIKLSNFSQVPNNKSILFIGRLVKDKGIFVAVKAMKHISTIYPDSRLVVVGDGSKKDKLELNKYIKDNNLTRFVTFVGKVNNHKVHNYYKNASLVIVPSIYPDNLPTVIIEAMGVGRPVVGSRIGGIPELIDHNKTGYLVNPNDPEELAKKIIHLLANRKLLNEYGQNARKKAELQFNIDKHVASMEKTYGKLLTQKLTYEN